MRIIFAGTPAFAAESLQSLINADHDIVAVYTQPDRPAGRGRKLTPSPVKEVALANNITVEQPLNFKTEDSLTQLAIYKADLMIVVAYGLLLPQRVLDTPKLGCINVHASLLPRWRGAAPIQRAILAGDKESGVCIMQMEAGLDTGPVLLEARCDIEPTDTTATLHDKLAQLGAGTLLSALNDLPSKQQNAIPQDDATTCYANKITKAEAIINWHQSAIEIDCLIRAFNPWPVAQTVWRDQVMRIWDAALINDEKSYPVGQVINITADSVDIGTESGQIKLKHIQLPGKRAMSIKDFLNANTLSVGEQLG